MSPFNHESQTKALLIFIGKQPGMMFSIAYLLLTLSGILYSSIFYSKFDIPILKLADISDLLIAGISEPTAIVMFCGGIVVAILTDWLIGFSYSRYNKWKVKPRSVKRTFMMMVLYTAKTRLGVVFTILITFVVYSFLFVSLFAEWRSEQIKSGKGDLVYLKTEKSNPTDKPVFLLGSTTNFVVIYDNQSKISILTPIENIQQIIPVVVPPANDTKKLIKQNVPSKPDQS